MIRPAAEKCGSARSRQMEKPTLVSIIIPALHRPDLTAKCVQSIRYQRDVQGQMDVFVVENAARPGAVYETAAGSHVHSLLLLENLGTTGSINRALPLARSKYVLLLNNDVELHPGFLITLIQTLETQPKLAFATGKLLDAKRDGYLDGAGDAMLLGGGAYRIGHGDADRGQFDSVRPVLSGCGAATLFRRDVLDQLGGLDEQLFAYLDDLDLSLRAHLLGYKGVYVPNASALHVGSATLANPLHPKIVSWITRNQMLVVIKNYPAGVLLRLAPRLLLYQLLWAARVFARGDVLPYLRGLFQTLWALPKALKDRHQRQRTRVLASKQFLEYLRDSERQIYDWHVSQERGSRSMLLRLYFAAFGRP